MAPQLFVRVGESWNEKRRFHFPGHRDVVPRTRHGASRHSSPRRKHRRLPTPAAQSEACGFSSCCRHACAPHPPPTTTRSSRSTASAATAIATRIAPAACRCSRSTIAKAGARRRRHGADDSQAAGEHDAAAGHAASRAGRLPEVHHARSKPSVDAYAKANPNPGGRTFQRLNRPEYTRAVKDLLDLDVDAGRLAAARHDERELRQHRRRAGAVADAARVVPERRRRHQPHGGRRQERAVDRHDLHQPDLHVAASRGITSKARRTARAAAWSWSTSSRPTANTRSR